MGMFDYVVCERPLPDGFTDAFLQSKTFPDPYLHRYTITRDGRLLRRAFYTHEITDTHFNGVLNFYGGNHRADGTWDGHEYNATFTDGQLVSIEQVAERSV